MFQAVIELPGLSGTMLLGVYCVAGLLTAGAAFLPGMGVLYRLLCLIVGTTMMVLAVKVLIFGGVIFVGRFVLLLPLVLLVHGVIGTVRHVIQRLTASPAATGTHPHPATRQFGGQASSGPGEYTAWPGRRGYATVHYEYPANPGVSMPSGPSSWSSRAAAPSRPALWSAEPAASLSGPALWSAGAAPRRAVAPMTPVAAVRARHRAPEHSA